MKHLLLVLALLVAPWVATPVRAADGVPARPQPFTFVTDQAGLLQPADVKRLDNGLRRYADNTGTQVVVVTVPSLGGQEVNAFARQLGTSWGVGQKDKNNGLVVLIAKQEHKLSIEPGSGLRATITPSVIQQAIGRMTPQFKQNDYAGGLRQGLDLLMVTANPNSAPKKEAAAATPAASAAATSSDLNSSTAAATSTAMSDPTGATQTPPAEAPAPGLPWGTLLLGAVVVIGGIFLLKRLFSGRSNAAGPTGPAGAAPNFYPNQNQPAQPGQPNFYPNQGPGYGAPQSGGMGGVGGILATGAAAAAGAYLGNRLGGSHDDNDSGRHFNNDTASNAGLGAGAAGGAAAAGSGGDYFASRDNNDGGNASPDYFSDNSSGSDSGDYFSGNDTSYDDSSGGGGFDDTSSDNSGSW